MKKYFFKTAGVLNDTCIEECNIKSGTMIGSVNCQECEFCIVHQKPCKFTGGIDWIKCSKLDKAIKKN